MSLTRRREEGIINQLKNVQTSNHLVNCIMTNKENAC